MSSDLSGSSPSLELSQHDRHSPSSSVSDKSSPSTEHPLSSLGGTTSPLSLGGDGSPSLSSLGGTTSPLSLGGDGSPSLSSLDGTLSPLSLGGDVLPSLSSFGDTPSSVSDDHPSPSSFGDAPSPSSFGGGLPSVEQVFEDKELFEPLYDGADITICGAYCCIMQFASSNKLSYTAISELIKLLHILCPAHNKLPSSFYMLKKFFKQFNVAFEHQRICTTCSTPVETGDSDCPTCTENGVYNPEAVGDLLHIPIQKALKTVISSK